jgi:hypothetical protein
MYVTRTTQVPSQNEQVQPSLSILSIVSVSISISIPAAAYLPPQKYRSLFKTVSDRGCVVSPPSISFFSEFNIDVLAPLLIQPPPTPPPPPPPLLQVLFQLRLRHIAHLAEQHGRPSAPLYRRHKKRACAVFNTKEPSTPSRALSALPSLT